jgi:glycerol-3-phosphate dehydrogenase
MRRELLLAQIETMQGDWDMLVIGGGASGLGIALDSVTRGYRTLLLERGDFSEGTSSKSTKLIHGGIRYLQQGRLPLVRKALVERGRLLANAPHLVHDLPFVIPAESAFRLRYYQAGIKLYEMLAGAYVSHKSCSLSKDALREQFPNLQLARVVGGVLYYDAQFDDTRLAISLAQTIVDHGGTAINYMQVERILEVRGKVAGVIAREMESGKEFEIRAKVVVNATGAFSDAIRRLDDPLAKPALRYSQGSHLVLPRTFFPSNHALVIPKTNDGRVLFLIPWQGQVLIGTTDKRIDEAVREPRVQERELEEMLNTANKYLVRQPRREDILGCFAGIRPLVKPPCNWLPSSWISRDHKIVISPSHLVSVLGGKWTTYRRIAEDVVDVASKVAQLPPRGCRTAQLRIHGWQETASTSYYGGDEQLVEQLAAEDKTLLQRLHPDIPCREVDILWSVRNEMARTVEDFLVRRSHCMFLALEASCIIASKVAQIMARELIQDANWEKRQVENIRRIWQWYASEKKIPH